MNYKSKLYIYIAIIIFTIFLVPVSKIFAGTSENVFGYAWSYNTGWISFNNCTNPADSSTCSGSTYGVVVDPSNDYKVTGYAWSSSLGWISFNPNDWGGKCPPGMSSCSNFVNKWKTGSSGWARAVSVVTAEQNASGSITPMDPNTGGWDGWISLNNTSFDWTKDISSTYYATEEGYKILVYGLGSGGNGYLWGSDVVGWIDANYDSSLNPEKGGVFIVKKMTIIDYCKENSTDPACDGISPSSPYLNFFITNYLSCLPPDTTIKPKLVWSSTIPDLTCGIKAKDSSDRFYNLVSSPWVDSNFKNVNTTYVLSCEDKDENKYTSQPIYVKMCEPDYYISSTNSCKGIPGIGADLIFDEMSQKWVANIDLNITALYGYSEDVDLTKAYGSLINLSGTTFNNAQGTITTTLELTQNDYDILQNPQVIITPLPEGVLLSTELEASDGINPDKKITIQFCDGSGGSFKPKYKPF